MRYLSIFMLLVISVQSVSAQTQESLFVLDRVLTYPVDLSIPWMGIPVDYYNDGVDDIIIYSHHAGGDAYIFPDAQGPAVYLSDSEWKFDKRDPLWVDADEDGDLDGVFSDLAYGLTDRLFLNDGVGNYIDAGIGTYDYPVDDLDDAELLTGLSPEARAKWRTNFYVDLDNDGTRERIISYSGKDSSNQKVEYSFVFSGSNDITTSIGLPSPNDRLYFPEDVNQDGWLDIVDIHLGDVFVNDGEGNFVLLRSDVFGREVFDGDGRVELADLDNNGFRDFIFYRNHENTYGIFMADGFGNFTELTGSLFYAPILMHRLAFADLDDDGDLDAIQYDNRYGVGYHTVTIFDNVTTNPGQWVEFTGDPMVGKVTIEQAGFIRHYRELFQENRLGTSIPKLNKLHVGGLVGPYTLTITDGATAPPPPPVEDWDAIALRAALDKALEAAADIVNSLHVPVPEIEAEAQNIVDSVNTIEVFTGL